MPTTPEGAPYPPGTGVPPNVPLWMQQLAEWTSGKVKTLTDSDTIKGNQITRLQEFANRYFEQLQPLVADLSPSFGFITAQGLTIRGVNNKMVAFNGGRLTRTQNLTVGGGARFNILNTIPTAARPFEPLSVAGLMGLSGNLYVTEIDFGTDGSVSCLPYAGGTLLGTANAEQNFIAIPPLVWRTAN